MIILVVTNNANTPEVVIFEKFPVFTKSLGWVDELKDIKNFCEVYDDNLDFTLENKEMPANDVLTTLESSIQNVARRIKNVLLESRLPFRIQTTPCSVTAQILGAEKTLEGQKFQECFLEWSCVAGPTIIVWGDNEILSDNVKYLLRPFEYWNEETEDSVKRTMIASIGRIEWMILDHFVTKRKFKLQIKKTETDMVVTLRDNTPNKSKQVTMHWKFETPNEWVLDGDSKLIVEIQKLRPFGTVFVMSF